MKVICIFFLFFIAYVYSQATLVQFSHTKLTTSTKGQFRVRRTRARLVNTNRIVGGSIKSVAVTKVNGEISLDGVRFAGFAINPILGIGGVAPTASSAFFTKEVDVNNDTATGNGVNYEVNKASNFVALRFFSLEEIDPNNNNIVRTIRFNSLDWSVVNSSATNTDVDVDLPYVTLHATTNNIVIQITFIATANLIKITYPGLSGGPIVPPKGMEVIFAADLTNYNYTSSTNYLRLTTFTATGSAQRQTNVTSPNPDITNKHSFITSESNGVPANVRFDQRATFYGQRVFNLAPNVSVSTDITGVFNGTDVSVQLSSFFGANSQLTRTDIPFEPNAKGIVVYDPTLSFGTDPTTVSTTQSNVSTLTISFALLFLSVLVSFF